MAAEQSVIVGGVTYRLAAPTARQSQEFLDFAKAAMPDPIEQVVEAANKLPEGSIRDKFLERHLDKAFEESKLRGKLNDRDLAAFTATEEGARKMCFLLFRRYHPELTEDQVIGIIEKAIDEHGPEYLSKAVGDLKKKAEKIPMTEAQVEKVFTKRRG